VSIVAEAKGKNFPPPRKDIFFGAAISRIRRALKIPVFVVKWKLLDLGEMDHSVNPKQFFWW